MDAINVAKDTADNTIVNWFTGKCSATGKSNNPMIASTGDVNYIGNKPPLSSAGGIHPRESMPTILIHFWESPK